MKQLYTLVISLIAGAALAQIPNNSFENWTTVGNYEVPDSWATLNHKTAANNDFTATKAAPGNPGSFYMKLTAKGIGGAMVPGIAVSGKMDTMTYEPISGFAFNLRPASLKGKWQHMVFGGSQGSVKTTLTKWNPNTSTRDTIAYFSLALSGMAMSWANFTIPLTYMDSLQYPDSCIIVLSASDGVYTANDYLWVDDLAFSGTVAVVSPPNTVGVKDVSAEKKIPFNLFPNPAKTQVTLSSTLLNEKEVSIEVYDAAGKIIKRILPSEQTILENSIGIKTEHWPRGIYSFVLRSGTKSVTEKLIIE